MKAILLSAVLCLATTAFADDLVNFTYEKDAKTIDKIKIASKGTSRVEERNSDLVSVGAAMRQKKVALFWVDVYVTQLLVSDNTKWDVKCKDKKPDAEALAKSIADQKTMAIRLDFRRSVSEEQIETAFRASFKANDVATDKGAIKDFFDLVVDQGSANKDDFMVLVGERLEKEDAVTLQNAKGEIKASLKEAGLMDKIFSIWLGTPAEGDKGLENLKNALLCGK